MSEKGFKFIVITNQAGIATKDLTEKKLNDIHNSMTSKLKELNIEIIDIFVSKDHWQSNHFRRKPNPGMILKAEKDHNIDLSESIMIGDKISDIQAGVAAGIKKNILFDPSNKDATEKSYIIYINNLKDAISYL